MPIREERLRRILDWINQESSVSISDLSSRLQVSTMTIWRDLEFLEAQGQIQRVRGGAIRTGAMITYEPLLESKQKLANDQKKIIARYVAENFIHDNDNIILEGGSTVAALLPFLNQSSLTLITNALNTLVRAANHSPRMTVISCGGLLREKSHTFVGPQAEAFFSDFRADTFFVSGTGLTASDGLTDPNLLEIQVKRAMKRASRRVIAMIDSSKIGMRSLAQIFPLTEVDILVTDSDASPVILDDLRRLYSMEIHIAQPR